MSRHDWIRESWARRVEKDERVAQRYRDMLGKARAWVPPTPEHEGLKDLMVEQLTKSLEFDHHEWDEPDPLSPEDWHEEQVRKAAWDIDYHTKEDRKARERARDRTRWIQALRESLDEHDPQPVA